MANQRPLVTAVITTYNREDRIARAIESVLNQTYTKMETIVVDDCSNYNIADYLSEYLPDIELIRNDENMGANWSRATGISRAKGDYIAFLDDDDRWRPNKIERQVEAITNLPPEYGVVTTGFERNDGTTIVPKLGENTDLKRSLLLGNNLVGGFSKILVDTSIIERAGLPDIHLSSSQDIEWFIRLSQECKFFGVQEPLVNFNEEGKDRITHEKVNKVSDSHGEILRKHSELVDEYGMIFKRKAWSNRNIRISRYAAANSDFGKCRGKSLKAIRLYPFNRTPYLLLILSLFGNKGYRLAEKLPTKIRRSLANR